MNKCIFLFGVIFLGTFVIPIRSDGCLQCDSGIDPKCATDPKVIFSKDCSNRTSSCYWKIVGTRTVRGCTADISAEEQQNCNELNFCGFCTGIGCNSGIFPMHRLQCLQCSSAVNSQECYQDFLRPKPCPVFRESDKCFIKKSTKNNKFERGCVSTDENVCKDNTNCYICEGHECNNLSGSDQGIPEAKDSAVQNGISFTVMTVGLLLTAVKMI